MKYRHLLILLGIIAAAFTIWYFSHIVIYIVVAGIISLVGQPIDRFYTRYLQLGRFKIGPTLSAGLAFITLFLFFFMLTVFFVPLAMEEAALISSLDRTSIMASLQEPLHSAEKILAGFNIDYHSTDLQAYFQEKVISFFTVTNISLLLNQFITLLGDFFIAFFAISFLTFFFLRDEQLIISSLFNLVPNEYSFKAKNVWLECERLLKRYFIGVLIEALLVVAFLFIGLWIAGIEHAFLIALFAGLMNIVPYVGPLIGCAFALFIGLTTNPDMTMLGVIIKILVIFPAVNLADAFLLQPLIYSSSVKAHPLEIFLVILAGATLGGIGGMILAVPCYTILRVIVKEFFMSFRGEKRAGQP
jgi:predicted PurR-regulated permease PerM